MQYFLMIFFLVGCVSQRQELTISAAISLQNAAAELKIAFEKENPQTEIHFNLAASGKLRLQIEAGAPIDIFLSASQKHMNILQEKELIIPTSRKNFAQNSLALIASHPHEHFDLQKLKGETICIGDPASVPAGRYAQEVLENLKLNAQVKKIYADHVRQVLAYVERKEVPWGIVYSSDINNQVQLIERLDRKLHSPILYPAAVIQGTKHEKDAHAFINFLLSPIGQAILKKHNFVGAYGP